MMPATFSRVMAFSRAADRILLFDPHYDVTAAAQ